MADGVGQDAVLADVAGPVDRYRIGAGRGYYTVAYIYAVADYADRLECIGRQMLPGGVIDTTAREAQHQQQEQCSFRGKHVI